MSDNQFLSWVFVCQAGRLELEACLLATSLRAMLGKDADLIAAVPLPESVMGVISPDVVSYLHTIGVQIRSFTNTLVEIGRESASKSELLMNKPFALELAADASIIVFVDSDQVCHSPFDFSNLSVPLVGRRAFYPGARAANGVWQRAYDICETQMPSHRIVARSRVKTDPVIVCPPYFNSGFISLHRPWVFQFVSNYLECYRRIAEQNLLGANRYYEEQMAMAIATIKTGVPYELDNHRIDMSFFHYYTIPRLASFERFAKMVRQWAETSPKLKELLVMDQQWRNLLNGTPVITRTHVDTISTDSVL